MTAGQSDERQLAAGLYAGDASHSPETWSEQPGRLAPAGRQSRPRGAVERRRPAGRRLADRLRDELLTVISHDFMTPLTALQIATDLLRRDVEDARAAPAKRVAGLAPRLDSIERQIARLCELVDLVREYLWWEGRTQELVRAPVDLRAVAARVVAALRPVSGTHRLVLVRPGGPVVGHWDARRLALVLQNLIGNAVKYSPAGGKITVAVQRLPHAPAALVRVRDTGIGLHPAEIERVFERGYRSSEAGRDASNGGSAPPAGSGFGLYLCRRIVEAHGGRLWAESAGPGRGSTFWITLPIEPAEELSTKLRPAASVPASTPAAMTLN